MARTAFEYLEDDACNILVAAIHVLDGSWSELLMEELEECEASLLPHQMTSTEACAMREATRYARS